MMFRRACPLKGFIAALIAGTVTGCAPADPFGDAYIMCLGDSGPSSDVKAQFVELADRFDLVITERWDGDVRDPRRFVGEHIQPPAPRPEGDENWRFFLTDSDFRGIIVAGNRGMPADELRLTIFPENARRHNEDLPEAFYQILESYGYIIELPKGAAWVPGYCDPPEESDSTPPPERR